MLTLTRVMRGLSPVQVKTMNTVLDIYILHAVRFEFLRHCVVLVTARMRIVLLRQQQY